MDDYREIERLIYRYASAIDDGLLEQAAALFSRGCVMGRDGEVLARGSAQVLDLYKGTVRLYPDSGKPHTRHMVSNVHIDIEGEHASASSYFTVLQALTDFPLQPIIAGAYQDRFHRHEGRWYFSERKMCADLIGDLSRHLLWDAERMRGLQN